MKRAFLSIIILVMGLAQSDAKISRTFFGVSLGESRQRVMQVMSINGYRIEDKPGGFTAYSTDRSHIAFRSYEWDSVEFTFIDDMLYSATFLMSAKNSSSKTVMDSYFGLVNQYIEDYRKYVKDAIDNSFAFNDKQTEVLCEFDFGDRGVDIEHYSDENVRACVTILDYKVYKKMNKAK